MIIVTGSVRVREGCLAEAIALSLEHVRRSRGEPGCLAHAVYQDVENPSRLFFHEQWADDTLLSAHLALPASRAFAKALGALAAAAPQMAIHHVQAR